MFFAKLAKDPETCDGVVVLAGVLVGVFFVELFDKTMPSTAAITTTIDATAMIRLLLKP